MHSPIKQLKKNTLSAEGFDRWYAIYPKKVSRRAAEEAYAEVIGAALIIEPDLLAKTTAFAAGWAGKPADDRKYIPHPATWLKGGRYADEPDAKASQSQTALPPISTDDIDDAGWRENLSVLDLTDRWSEHWGPRPGMPGCRVPGHLIGERVQEGALRAAATPVQPVR